MVMLCRAYGLKLCKKIFNSRKGEIKNGKFSLQINKNKETQSKRIA